MSIYLDGELNNVLNSADSVKELPNELVEKLKTALLIQIFWGYLGGVTEATYRK